jgi:hypothetical protein
MKKSWMIMAMLAVAAALVLGAGRAEAGVVEFRQAQIAADPVHHYTFENSENRGKDTGSVPRNLTTSGSPDYDDPGYDSGTTAITTDNGGLYSNAWTLPSTQITVEYLIKLTAHGSTTGQGAYAVFSHFHNSDGSERRGYWGLSSTSDLLYAQLGDPVGFASFSPTLDHWYYVAVTADETSGSESATLYYADLSAGDLSLTAVSLTDFGPGFSGSDLRMALGSRLLDSGYDSSRMFRGSLDEVAFYDGVLEESTLLSHYQTLLPPVSEPAGLGLLGLALLGLRKRRS